MCSPWSNINNAQKDQAKVMMKRKQNMPMLRFCEEVVMHQIKHGRYFILENPKTSKMWVQKPLLRLAQCEKVTFGETDMCRHGLCDPQSKQPMRKPTYLMHNFPEGQLDLAFQVSGRKQKASHQPSVDGR